MDNPKHKDGMLAAGKKRLEQYRLKKQGKGSSSNQKKQETDIEHGRPRSEVESASHKGSKSKVNATGSDIEGIQAKGGRTLSSNDEQGAANTIFGDDSKGILHDLIVDKPGDKASLINIEHTSASDGDIGSAHTFYTEGNILEQCTMAGEEMLVDGSREFSSTVDCSHLQPSIAGQSEKPVVQDRLDFVGAPDLTINVADLSAQDLSRDHYCTNVEHGTMKGKNENILFNSVEAFQACNKEQDSESSATSIPSCSSNDCQDVIIVETKSICGNQMTANDHIEACSSPDDSGDAGMAPSSPITRLDAIICDMKSEHDANDIANYVPPGVISSSQVLTFSQSKSGKDEGGASQQSGRDFDAGDARMAPSSSMITDVLEIVAPVANKEEELCSRESSWETHSISVSKAEPIDLHTDVVPVLSSEDDSNQTPSDIKNVTDSQSKAILVGSVSLESSSFDQPQPPDLDVSMVKVMSESILDYEGHASITDHGLEGSGRAATSPTGGNTTGLHCKGRLDESVPFNFLESTGSQVIGESVVSLVELPLKSDLDHEEISPTNNDGHKGEENTFSNPIVGSSDIGLTGTPTESSLDFGGISLTYDHVSSGTFGNGMPVVQREGVSDLEGTESSEPEGCQDGTPVVQTEGMSELKGLEFSGQEGLKVDKVLDQDGMSVVQREGILSLVRTESLEQEDLKADKVLDQFSETTISTTINHHHIVTSSRDNLLPNGADWESVSEMPSDLGQGASGSGYVESSMSNTKESSFEDNLRFFRSLEVVVADQATVKDHVKTESVDNGVANTDLGDHRSSTSSSGEVTGSDAFGQTPLDSWDLREGPLLGFDIGSGIDQGEMDRPPITDPPQVPIIPIRPENGKVSDGSIDEMTLPKTVGVLTNSLEKEESTGPSENLKPPLEFRSGLIKDEELGGEVPLDSNNDSTGIAPSTFTADTSCSKSFLEDTGDACGYLKHEVVSYSLDAERDLTAIQQGKEDMIGEADRMKLEVDDPSPPHENEVVLTQGADVCSCRPDLESRFGEPSELSTSFEHVLSAHKTSNLVDHVGLQDSPEMYEAVSFRVKPGVCVDEAPLSVNANEAFEEGGDPSVLRSLMEDQDSNVNSSETLLLDTREVGQAIEVYENIIQPIFCDTSGSAIEGKEGIDSKAVVRELQDTLCMKQAELANIMTLLNAQAAKNLEERGLFVRFLMDVMNRLSYFVPEESIENEYADLQFQLFDADIAGFTKFEHFVQDFDCWMDKIQKDLEEKRELEATKKHLEDIQLMKDSEIKELLKQVEDLSQKYTELQKDSDMKEQQMTSRRNVLEELLAAKDSDIERLSDVASELTYKCELTMNEMAQAVEEKLGMEGNVKQLEALLIVKDTDIGRLSDEVSELSKKCDGTMVELAKAMEERANSDRERKELEDLLLAKEIELRRMLDSMSELSQKCDLTSAEMGNVWEEKVVLEGELKHFQNLHAEQASKTRHLEDLLPVKDTELENLKNLCAEQESKIYLLEEVMLRKDTELESLQKLYGDERDEHLGVLTRASALAEKVSALLDPPTEVNDGGDAIGMLEILVASLHHQYEAIFKENKDLASRAIDSDTAYEVELRTLRTLVSEKEADLYHAEKKIDLLTTELSKTKEDGERKLQEAEQKALGVRERLSLAVTKGKGLVQQRDNLKQLLAEKTAELEALALSYQQELHAKTIALNDAERRAKLNSEAGERVEALESELSYIRNSANALRESFLQKDAVLQKVEELLEDSSFPEELQIKDTYEKIEWLLESRNQKVSTLAEEPSQILTTRSLNTDQYAEQVSQTEEIEKLNRKCDEYVRKYRTMAEELAMLEQSLLERNMLIQRWEEMLDNVDMPATIRSKEPEDKIQWLGTAVSDACNSIAHLQADLDSLQTTADTLNHSLQTLQEQNSLLSAELIAKEDELRAVALDMENMTMKFNSLAKPASESNDEGCRPMADALDLEVSEDNQEESQQLQQEFQIPNLSAFISKIRMLLIEVLQEDEVDKIFADLSASAAFETSVRLLVENSKIYLAEARETRGKLSELTLAMRKVEEDSKEQVQSLHEAVSSKTIQLDHLNSQLEGFDAKITSLEDEVDHLQKEVKAKAEELSFVRDELNKSHLEASQGEEKLTSVREKLSMAVKKGKSVVQQRDTLKQSLDEKIAEIDQLRRDYEAETVAFTKAKHSFKHQLQELEVELTSSRKYATTLEKSLQENSKTIQKFAEALDKFAIAGAPRSGDLMEKIQWTSQLVLDLQRKAGINEQEAKKSKKATELLALELEEVQGRMDSLADELMHAEKNISLLIEEKKLAEASRAEAGLRLEHAMANINSLLFELSESKDARANLEQENSSLKDSLAAQMEEIRSKHTKAEEQLRELTDLHNKVHALKANGSIILGRVANEVFKLLEDVKGTRGLIVRISSELKEQGSVTLPTSPAFEENSPPKWEPELLNKRKATQEWKQGVTTGSIRLMCEEMEIELQNFDIFLNNCVSVLNNESAENCQLLAELYNGLGSFTKKMETLRRDADFASSTESLILEKAEQLRALEEVLKTVAQKVRSCIEEVEELRKQSGSSFSPRDGGLALSSHESSLQSHTVSMVERLSSSVKDLAQSCQHICIEREKQNEELRFQLKEAKDAVDVMGRQQQIEKLKLQKCLEEFEGKDDILKRTNEELCSLQDVLASKNQEERGLAEALEKAETKIGQLSTKVEELENAKQELEASLGKASSRFYATINNFNTFQSLSEKLIEEAESLHLLLEDRDAQISLLKAEVAHKASEMTDLKNLVDERTADLAQVYQQIGVIVNREASNGELLLDPGRRREILEALATSVRAGSESLRVQLARKDALLQDIQLRHDDLVRKVHVLESSVQESQRLMEERDTAEHMMITVEAEEKGNRGKHTMPSVALVSHGRVGRKAAADHSTLDVDTESARLLADMDDEDKGHVFKPLTSSRLVPRGTRILVDRLDGFWVSGERLLRRRPGARLTLMLYWLVLNIWMVATLL